MGENRRTLSLSMSDDRTRATRSGPKESGGPVNGSKADFKTLITDLIDPIIILNRLGTVCFTNPAAKEFFKQGLGPRVEEYLKKHGNKKASTQVRFHLKDGGDAILRVSRRHIQWIDKPAVLVSIQDVTQYVKTAARMRDSNLRTLSLLERVTDASFVIEVGEGTVPPYLSPQFDALIGKERASWNTDPQLWRQFIHEDDRSIVIENVEKAVHERKPFSAEYRLRTANGNVIWVREKARIDEEEETALLMLSGYLVDITQERNAAAPVDVTVKSTEDQGQLSQLERALAAARKAQSALQEERDQLDEILKKRTAAYAVEAQQTADATEQLQARIGELESSVETLDAGRGELEEQLNQRSADIEDSRERLAAETAAREKAEAQVEEIRKSLTEASHAAEKVQSELQRAEAERDRQSEELAKTREEMARQAAEHEETAASGDALQQRLTELEASAAELTSSREQLDEQLRQRAIDLEQINERLTAETTQREEAESRAEELQQHLVEANRAIEDLRAERKDIEASRDERVAELEKAREELQQQIAVSAQSIEDLKISQRHLKDQWNQRAAELKKESEDLREEVLEARRVAEEADSARANLDEETLRKIADLEKKRDQFQADLSKSEEAADKARASSEQLEAELDRLRNDLKKAQRDLTLRAEAAKRAEETLHQYRGRFEEWAKKSAVELLTAAEHLRHEPAREAQEDPPGRS